MQEKAVGYIASPPDRDFAVYEIDVKGSQVFELFIDNKSINIEIACNNMSKNIILDLNNLMALLNDGKIKLNDVIKKKG